MRDKAEDRSFLKKFAWLSVAAAVATIFLKTVAYFLTGSIGLLSDAVESLVNLAGAMMALAMLTVAARPPDKDHAYGHSKAEYFSSAVEGTLILVAALAIAAATGSEPTTYSYDSNGNITNDTTHTYQFGQRNRLATVDTGTTATYSYDGDGRRVKKVAGGTTTLYFYDTEGKLLEEYIPATGAGKDYLWMPKSYEPVARIDFSMTDADTGDCLRAGKSSPDVVLDWSIFGGSGNFMMRRGTIGDFYSYSNIFGPSSLKTCDDAVLEDTNSYWYDARNRSMTDTLYFYHADHLGTPIAMTDTSGTLVWRAEHSPYGGIYALLVGTINNNLRFSGQYFDAETGLAQNGWRDYSANLGGYYEVDPLIQIPMRPKKCKSNIMVSSYSKSFPLITTDFYGGTELVGFPSSALSSLSGSVLNALKGLKTCCNCIRCKNAFEQLLKATIFFNSKESACGVTYPYAQSELFAPSLHNKAYFALPFFTTGAGVLPGGSCCAAQTFAEEALHLAGATDSNNEAGQISARCVPCR